MKLFFYEMIKLLKRRSFWIVLLSILCVNCMLIKVEKTKEDPGDYKQLYETQIRKEIQLMDVDEAIVWLQEEIAFYDIIQQYEVAQVLPEEMPDITDEQIKRYQQYEEDAHYWQERCDVIKELEAYEKQVASYANYLEGIQKNIAQSTKSPLWRFMSQEEKEDMYHQADIYKKLDVIQVEPIHYKPVEVYAKSMISRLLSLFLICMLAVLINKEDDTNIKELLMSTPRGHMHTALAKILCFLCVSVISVLLIQFTSIACYRLLYGAFDLHAPIQAVPCLYQSPYIWTIGQWLLLSSVAFAFGISMMGLLFLFLYHVFDSKLFSFSLFFMLFLVEAICYVNLSQSSIFAIFSYINLIRMFEGTWIGSVSVYYHIIGIRFSFQILLLLLCTLLGVFSALLFALLYDCKIRSRKLSVPSFTMKTTHLFLQEANRMLQTNKGILVLVCMIVFPVGSYLYKYDSYDSIRQEEAYDYEVYQQYEGYIDEETKKELQEKMDIYAAWDKGYAKAQEDYKNGTISYESYVSMQRSYEDKYSERMVYQNLYDVTNHMTPYIVYNKGFDAIFSLHMIHRDAGNSIFIMIGILLFISTIYSKREEEQLYRTTYKGRAMRRNRMWTLVLFGSLLIFVIVEGCTYMHFSSLYPMRDFSAPLRALWELNGIMGAQHLQNLTTGQYMACLWATRLFGILSFSVIATGIFRLSKNRVIALLTCTAIFFVPMFLYYSGFDFISAVSLFDLIMGNLFLQQLFSYAKLVLLFVMDILCILLVSKTYKRIDIDS